jgi:tetratricopeptide (TPR) repeat protein
MKAKIDWYKEVLELEPGSKVFFPLARLLAENGQLQDALSTLRLGLERHTEFMEARLYLIELLYKNEQVAQCELQITQLTHLFSKYPGFWEAWGTCTAGTEKKRDLSLALRFLAVLFQHPDVDLGKVLEKGFSSLAAKPLKMPLTPKPEMETGKKILPADAATRPAGRPVIPPATAATADTTDAAATPVRKPVIPSTPAVTTDAPVKPPVPAAKRAEDLDDTEEPFTLRTKSMADVLAGQSDIDGALEIYRELALSAESPEERQEINERIAELSSPQVQADDAPSPPPGVAPPPGKQRMQHLLESLAERLEERASG